MQKMTQKEFTGERAQFFAQDAFYDGCVFRDGESPLKHSRNVTLENCLFKWKYPLWYSENARLNRCTLFTTARAGIWYTKNVAVKDGIIEAPKTFRRAENIALENVFLPNAAETLWTCKGITGKNVSARGDYFAMNSSDITLDGFELIGDYGFDGVENVEIANAKMVTKDAFWNSKNVTVRDSFISGEYLGWNAENLTLENCTIESLQGLCYVGNLVMRNCRLLDTTLAFEYSTVDADIHGKIDSVLNPSGGRITADEIGELIVEKDRVDPSKTRIIARNA